MTVTHWLGSDKMSVLWVFAIPNSFRVDRLPCYSTNISRPAAEEGGLAFIIALINIQANQTWRRLHSHEQTKLHLCTVSGANGFGVFNRLLDGWMSFSILYFFFRRIAGRIAGTIANIICYVRYVHEVPASATFSVRLSRHAAFKDCYFPAALRAVVSMFCGHTKNLDV